MEQKMKMVTDKKFIYPLCFLIPLGVMVGCMICYGVEPFGDHSFVIIDGLHQYMPFFSVFYDKLKGGEGLFYTFKIGLGINFLSLYSYYLSSPLNIFILLFKKSQLNMAVSMLIVFKIALSGLTAGIYFSSRKKKPDLSVAAAACMYSLNSYMVGYSWNVMWLDALLIFPIIMMGIERLIEKNDGRLYCLALFYALYCNYYIAFMICIFCVLWYLIYPFKHVKQFFLRGFVFAFYSFLAAGMAAVILVPAYMGIKQTASGAEMGLPFHEWITSFIELLNRQFDLTAPISHDNFDGNANLYFGTAAILTLVLYLVNREIKLADKLKRVALLAFLYISFNEFVLNFIWHGFHDQYGIPNRFSFLFGFVLIEMFVGVSEHTGAIKNWQIVLASAAGIGLLFLCRHYAESPLDDAEYGVVGMLFVVYGTVLLMMTISRRYKHWYLYFFYAAVIVELCCSAVIGFDTIGQIQVSKFFSKTKDMQQAVKELEDGTFFRSELADSKFVDESSWYCLNGVSLFGSTARDETVNLMDSLGFYTGCNEYLYKGSTPLTDLLLDVRYLFFHPEDQLKTVFEYKKDYGDMSLYENPVKGLSAGYLINEDIVDWYYENDYPFQVLNDFTHQGYGVHDLFHYIEIPDPVTKGCTASKTNEGEYHFSYEETRDDNLVFTIPFKEKADHLYLFYDGTQVENVLVNLEEGTANTGGTSSEKVDPAGQKESADGGVSADLSGTKGEEISTANLVSGDKDGIMMYAGAIPAGSKVTVSMKLKGETDEGYIRLSAATFDQARFEKLAQEMTSQAFKVTKWSDGHMEGTVSSKDGQMLMLSIPYDEGWKIKVDGVTEDPDDYEIIGFGLLGIYLEEGDHEIIMDYTPPGYVMGRNITLISLGIFILICLGTHLWKKKKKQKQALAVQSLQELAEATPLEFDGSFGQGESPEE